MELTANPRTPPIALAELPADELATRIAQCRDQLGSRVLVLGHHYQADDIIVHADATGDSFRLAQLAAGSEAPFIVFAGVHFMAESADVLTPERQTVILPDLRAGCSMADMAHVEDVESVWSELMDAETGRRVVPITYVNSSAALKAFVARHGGAVCTSSNAAAVLRWAFDRADQVLFVPDQHLGRNVALDLGVPADGIRTLDIGYPRGGLTPDELRRTDVLLWCGHCSVHTAFLPAHVAHWRSEHPQARIIVHPECMHEVVTASDQHGSTGAIIRAIEQAEPGSTWAVGTEMHLVQRLQAQMPDRTVKSLSPFPCLCSTMYRIRPAWLLWVLEELLAGRPQNVIRVPHDVAVQARVALRRMLDIPA
ncbi:MAG: quinolinate synthase NadA [Planctomycetota bacterium]